MKRGILLSCLLSCAVHLYAFAPSKNAVLQSQKKLHKVKEPECISIPEGGFVYAFHPMISKWLEQSLTFEKLKHIEQVLGPQLKIPLTEEGYTMASTRRDEDDIDETNYSAIWVRDACWHYFGLEKSVPSDAKRLILNLLDFYASQEQMRRFLAVIKNPEIADPSVNPNAKMDVPLVRFSRKTLLHYQVKGEDQEWTHLQFDSHGLFLLAVMDAISKKILLVEELKEEHLKALALFPAFFNAADYANRKDAGPWEEVLLKNASTAGIIASGLHHFMEMLHLDKTLQSRLNGVCKQLKRKINSYVYTQIIDALDSKTLESLIQKGVKRVEENIKLGGEAPDLLGDSIDRRADIALIFLCLTTKARKPIGFSHGMRASISLSCSCMFVSTILSARCSAFS